MLQEYDIVCLKRTVSSIPLPPATKGTVLIVYPSNPPAYEVEFVDVTGKSLGTYTVEEDNLERGIRAKP
jgi:hypothetical protein